MTLQVNLKIVVFQLQRLPEEQPPSDTSILQRDAQNKGNDLILKIKEDLCCLQAKVTEELSAFKADKLAYFNRNSGRKKEDRQKVDGVSSGLAASIRASSMPIKLLNVWGETPCLIEAVELGCLALHGLRSELDAVPRGIDVPDNLISGHISAMLKMTVRLPAFQASDWREWMILHGEFRRDWERFDKWTKKHHPFQAKTSRLSLLGRIGPGLSRLIRGAFSRPTDDSVPESLVQELILELQALTVDGETSANDISSIAGPDAAESVDAINSTDEVKTVQGDVPATWRGPLVNAEDVSQKLFAVGKEIDAQTLKNKYWEKWKPQDHMKGRAFYFNWDRIMPIVEEQFDVKFEDQ